jgi:hypothetical protein
LPISCSQLSISVGPWKSEGWVIKRSHPGLHWVTFWATIFYLKVLCPLTDPDVEKMRENRIDFAKSHLIPQMCQKKLNVPTKQSPYLPMFFLQNTILHPPI